MILHIKSNAIRLRASIITYQYHFHAHLRKTATPFNGLKKYNLIIVKKYRHTYFSIDNTKASVIYNFLNQITGKKVYRLYSKTEVILYEQSYGMIYN